MKRFKVEVSYTVPFSTTVYIESDQDLDRRIMENFMHENAVCLPFEEGHPDETTFEIFKEEDEGFKKEEYSSDDLWRI
tara:strand:- start:735 stop:968 length:234 start_codon:yes stop_codon:yes gene_type:complete